MRTLMSWKALGPPGGAGGGPRLPGRWDPRRHGLAPGRTVRQDHAGLHPGDHVGIPPHGYQLDPSRGPVGAGPRPQARRASGRRADRPPEKRDSRPAGRAGPSHLLRHPRPGGLLGARLLPPADPNYPDRVRSFAAEAAPGGGTAHYTWPNLRGGTYLYQSGTQPQVQVQMGLYGACTKDYAAGQAYSGVPYTTDVMLLYSEVDPALHAAVVGGNYGPGKPVTSTMEYEPKYFLVNGVGLSRSGHDPAQRRDDRSGPPEVLERRIGDPCPAASGDFHESRGGGRQQGPGPSRPQRSVSRGRRTRSSCPPDRPRTPCSFSRSSPGPATSPSTTAPSTSPTPRPRAGACTPTCPSATPRPHPTRVGDTLKVTQGDGHYPDSMDGSPGDQLLHRLREHLGGPRLAAFHHGHGSHDERVSRPFPAHARGESRVLPGGGGRTLRKRRWPPELRSCRREGVPGVPERAWLSPEPSAAFPMALLLLSAILVAGCSAAGHERAGGAHRVSTKRGLQNPPITPSASRWWPSA